MFAEHDKRKCSVKFSYGGLEEPSGWRRIDRNSLWTGKCWQFQVEAGIEQIIVYFTDY
ncbi:MAG: hypothetical protein F6K17_38410 [Okeania sp. SIO3C4]|nr:hypothetical protein [Okeania sp. SIO3B3]NER08012.1 hypothetical protein [Okeania sp. SIO3C4]